MFTSSYGSRRFGAWDQGSHLGFFPPRSVFLSRPVGLSYYEKSRDICVFWSDKLINNFNVSSSIKITLHCGVYMRTSGEKVCISDEAERVQSVSYSHMRSLSGLYAAVYLIREGKRGTYLRPFFGSVMCKVACLAFKGAQRNCNALFFQRAPSIHLFLMLHNSIWGIEAFSEVLSGDGSGISGPLWQCGSHNWGVWSATDTALLRLSAVAQNLPAH